MVGYAPVRTGPTIGPLIEPPQEGDQLITGIAYIEMRTRNFDECREVYGKHLGLTEVQDTTAVLNESGEWESRGSAESGNREAVLQVGDSFLVLHEDEKAPTQVSPKGERVREAQGSVGHWSFFVEGNFHAYSHLKDFLAFSRFPGTKEGPAVQPMNHSYLQRTLLEFADPNGYTIQLSEIVDPRHHEQERRREKQRSANLATGAVIKGFDHINMSCPDINNGKAMYGDKLGMPIIDHSDSEAQEGYVFVAGLCDIELGTRKDGAGADRLGSGIVGSFGLWSDDVDALAKEIGHATPPAERDLALGVPIRSITLDVGDGLPIEVAQRL